MAYDCRTVPRRSGRRAGLFQWTIGAVLTVGLAFAGVFWNSDGDKIDKEANRIESFPPPKVAPDPAIGARVLDLALRSVEIGESESLTQFTPSIASTSPEPNSIGSPAAKPPVTALAQFGNSGPGGRGAGNPTGRGGPGNGNQFPGSGNQSGPGGQGAGGVYIATKIQLEPNATSVLTDYRDNAVLARPTSGRFSSD